MPDDRAGIVLPSLIKGAVTLMDLGATHFEGGGKNAIFNAPGVWQEDDASEALIRGERFIDALQYLEEVCFYLRAGRLSA
jgi:hypothetical protein